MKASDLPDSMEKFNALNPGRRLLLTNVALIFSSSIYFLNAQGLQDKVSNVPYDQKTTPQGPAVIREEFVFNSSDHIARG